ncbi:hypothetical protein B296_00046715 [Ensete ventricosum]|uniref:PRONE domain-containing protein n=1 Tax=Ensete ventricosum TaxID=4639 RepID=A0A426XEJ8_ENSVE|nr:hypothetical protein B296_00046715 [Ensete ventricosum]
MPSPISAVSVLWFPTSSSPLLGRQLQVMQLGSSSTATVFGQLWRLEPLPPEKKSLWRREMEWLLCVSDHIVELVPSWQTFPDGSKLEVHACCSCSNFCGYNENLECFCQTLSGILDGFNDPEFWYVDQGIVAPDSDGSASFRRTLCRQEDKWWLPVPHVPLDGLHEHTRKQLQHKRECASQILKASIAINTDALTEMEVPESYLSSLPKDLGKSILESYSRVLESLAFNIVARIDELLYVDDFSKNSDHLLDSRTGVITHRKVSFPCSVPTSDTAFANAYSAAGFSPAPLISSTREECPVFVDGKSHHNHGFGVKKILKNYLGVEVKGTTTGSVNVVRTAESISCMNTEA